jgi:hypothetical protein
MDKNINEDAAAPSVPEDKQVEPTPMSGPVVGVAWAEARAWLQTWGTGRETAPPKPRRIE